MILHLIYPKKIDFEISSFIPGVLCGTGHIESPQRFLRELFDAYMGGDVYLIYRQEDTASKTGEKKGTTTRLFLSKNDQTTLRLTAHTYWPSQLELYYKGPFELLTNFGGLTFSKEDLECLNKEEKNQ